MHNQSQQNTQLNEFVRWTSRPELIEPLKTKTAKQFRSHFEFTSTDANRLKNGKNEPRRRWKMTLFHPSRFIHKQNTMCVAVQCNWPRFSGAPLTQLTHFREIDKRDSWRGAEDARPKEIEEKKNGWKNFMKNTHFCRPFCSFNFFCRFLVFGHQFWNGEFTVFCCTHFVIFVVVVFSVVLTT